jgi:RNA polymerase sigma-70 factor, ECF subfamily
VSAALAGGRWTRAFNSDTDGYPRRTRINALNLPHPLPEEERALRLEALLAGVAAGDQEALAALYDLTVAKVYALARAVLGTDADAEEAVSDAYHQVWQGAARFDRSRGSASAWLMTIARTRALDLLRQRRAFHGRHAPEEAGAREEQPDLQRQADELLAHFQEGSAARDALEALAPLPRRLLGLAFFQGMTHQEIAAECALPLGTVKSHLRRALLVLRAELEERS